MLRPEVAVVLDGVGKSVFDCLCLAEGCADAFAVVAVEIGLMWLWEPGRRHWLSLDGLAGDGIFMEVPEAGVNCCTEEGAFAFFSL